MSLNTLTSTIHKALAAAGLDPQSKRLVAVTDTIRQALNAAGLTQSPMPMPMPGPAATPGMNRGPAAPSPGDAHPRQADADVIDVEAKEIPSPRPTDAEVAREARQPSAGTGQFMAFSYANNRGQRDYKLYVPAGYTGQPLPLVVMLHGCKQNPDDFARGTRMNELAEQQGFLVLYPAQAARANGGNCWNWFSRAEQERDGEEPSLIAGMVGQVAASYAVDRSRVFAAGLSAGAAMATIVGARYPEVFKAVAVHAGLPLGAANDVASAFGAMRGGSRSPLQAVGQAVPTIVFHGDADTTVAAVNGRRVVEQSVNAFDAASAQPLHVQVAAPQRVGGRECTVTCYVDDAGRARVEAWTVGGAGHAWFGGSAQGSYTDTQGPDASREMLRFFLAQ